MNKEQLAVLTPREQEDVKALQRMLGLARVSGGTGRDIYGVPALQELLTALADARLEVARLTKERERARDLLAQAMRPTPPLWEAIDTYLREEKYDARS